MSRPTLIAAIILLSQVAFAQPPVSRERISINAGWRFMRYTADPDKLIYDTRPAITPPDEDPVADHRPTEAATASSSGETLKKWILPTANDFIRDPARQHQRPDAGPDSPNSPDSPGSPDSPASPGSDFPFVQNTFNDAAWELVNLPHDWAIKYPFYEGAKPVVGGGMGRLPSQGVAWYRRKLDITPADSAKCIYLDIDGAMSYAMVWLNGNLVGGWPYGYNSFRLDLTRYLNFGGDNQLAIRLDNPPNSSRWYPGGGIYRNVWLTKVNPVHVAQWGVFISSRDVSASSAVVDLAVKIENRFKTDQRIDVVTEIYPLNNKLERIGERVATFSKTGLSIRAGDKLTVSNSVTLRNPFLWGPPPSQKPNLYVAVTHLYIKDKPVDECETRFGVRSLKFDAVRGLLVNGKRVRIQGVNQHHDLGALGAAFNVRAAERQLKLLSEMGCNAIRMAHNPPAPELLDLADRMGFLVIDEIFDCWEKGKTPLDFHLIFPDWHEPDTRAFIRRDRNHPSIIAWSFGNEVGEQYAGEEGAALAKELHDIIREEDSTRPSTTSMNYARADMPFPKMVDIISLNYQGEGIRDTPPYAHLKGVKTPPLYAAFHEQFPGKLIVSSETASALSSRGTYLFPVFAGISAPVSDSTGGNPRKKQVSAYDLYTAPFGASPDKVFAAQDRHPFVAGEFVWSGWDYLGEPTPYYSARSSYSGIIDLAGFPKDRFYLYQSRWRPDLPMAHILPHWTWLDRIGKVTPVQVYSSGDEAELFLNSQSLGRKKKGEYDYRFRWDSVVYTPGELKVVAYKKGKKWATDSMRTADAPARLELTADRSRIQSDGDDLSFITARIVDSTGTPVPEAGNHIKFVVSDGGELVATDNGDPADLTPFHSEERAAFNGLALVIIRAKARYKGPITITATSAGMKSCQVVIESR